MKLFLAIVIYMISSLALSESLISQDIFSDDGNRLGSVWTDRDSWNTKDCADDSDGADCPDKGEISPFVCMEYSNDAIIPIVCRLTVSALLAEPFTGFIKVVTDIRHEVVFYNQTHTVCFNFGKDQYNAWFLLELSDPIIECKEWSVDKGQYSRQLDLS